MSIIRNPFDHTYKLLHHPGHLQEVISGERPFPIHLEIDLTNVCNHACSFCNMAETLANSNSILNSNILEARLIEAFSLGAKAISFSGGGEPTMHPDFSYISKVSYDLGYKLGLITNASLLIGDKASAVVNYYDWIRVSLGGPDPKSYQIIQGKDDYHRVLNNIYKLAEKKTPGNNLNIGLKIMLTEANMRCVDQLVPNLVSNNLSSNQIDYIQFVPDQYTSDGGLFVSSEYVTNTLKVLKEELDEIGISLMNSFFSVNSEDRDLDLSSRCYAHFYQMVITAEGDITFCKNTRENKKLLVGNIYQNSLSEIWNSSKIIELESYINAANCGSFCKSLKINNLIHSLKNPQKGYSCNFF